MAAKTEQIKEITEKLEEGIKNLFQSEQYKQYLFTMSRFTNYSFNNTVLIAMQSKGAASLVAGFSTWKQCGRYPRKGEKAMKIICPRPVKKTIEAEKMDSNGNVVKGADGKPVMEKKERIDTYFSVGNVFDISQTDGEPLPEIAVKLDGSVEGYQDFMKALAAVSPVPIEFEPISVGANGYYSMADGDKKIVIDSEMSEVMHCKTGIHELAHAMLHDRESGLEKDKLPDARTKEVQAESIAFTVSSYYGLDTSAYSFGYIAGWSSGRDIAELKDSLEVIRQTSDSMITKIDQQIKKIQMDRAKTAGIDLSAEIDSKPRLSIKR